MLQYNRMGLRLRTHLGVLYLHDDGNIGYDNPNSCNPYKIWGSGTMLGQVRTVKGIDMFTWMPGKGVTESDLRKLERIGRKKSIPEFLESSIPISSDRGGLILAMGAASALKKPTIYAHNSYSSRTVVVYSSVDWREWKSFKEHVCDRTTHTLDTLTQFLSSFEIEDQLSAFKGFLKCAGMKISKSENQVIGSSKNLKIVGRFRDGKKLSILGYEVQGRFLFSPSCLTWATGKNLSPAKFARREIAMLIDPDYPGSDAEEISKEQDQPMLVEPGDHADKFDFSGNTMVEASHGEGVSIVKVENGVRSESLLFKSDDWFIKVQIQNDLILILSEDTVLVYRLLERIYKQKRIRFSTLSDQGSLICITSHKKNKNLVVVDLSSGTEILRMKTQAESVVACGSLLAMGHKSTNSTTLVDLNGESVGSCSGLPIAFNSIRKFLLTEVRIPDDPEADERNKEEYYHSTLQLYPLGEDNAIVSIPLGGENFVNAAFSENGRFLVVTSQSWQRVYDLSSIPEDFKVYNK